MYRFELFNPPSKKNNIEDETLYSPYWNTVSKLEDNMDAADDYDSYSDAGSDSDNSVTSQESWMDEIIRVRGEQFLLGGISTDSRELEDRDTKKRFFLSRIGELYYNKIGWHADSLKTSTELAVCGGRMFALLMGAAQPDYFVGETFNNEEDEYNYYLISRKVYFIAQEKEIFDLNQPIADFITSLIISFFLGDPDVSNVGVVQNNNTLQTVRFDPEFCFSSYFIDDTYQRILKELRFIYDLNLGDVPEQRVFKLRQILSRGESDFFARCFTKRLLWEPAFLEILSSPQRKQEIFKALDRISTTLLTQYQYIIDTTISNGKLREALTTTLTKRREIFSQVNGELKLLSQVARTKDTELSQEEEYVGAKFSFTLA